MRKKIISRQKRGDIPQYDPIPTGKVGTLPALSGPIEIRLSSIRQDHSARLCILVERQSIAQTIDQSIVHYEVHTAVATHHTRFLQSLRLSDACTPPKHLQQLGADKAFSIQSRIFSRPSGRLWLISAKPRTGYLFAKPQCR